MKKIIVLVLLSVFMLGWFIPETTRIPVRGATAADWNPQSFWYYPWGRSGTHKGIDIFASKGTPVLAASDGLVLRTGVDPLGGNYVLVLGAKWRFHYYAHLQSIDTSSGHWLKAGSVLGKVGDSGNAQGKPPHLHYQIQTAIPQWAHYQQDQPQAWHKLFYINPNEFLTQRKAF
ncbi:MAG: hypothetical protein RLZZ215_3356 [Pseudomonadota bacterium]|jgi:murein DD-endopeptidase MepM/ murein hydrolase activator NlpD